MEFSQKLDRELCQKDSNVLSALENGGPINNQIFRAHSTKFLSLEILCLQQATEKNHSNHKSKSL